MKANRVQDERLLQQQRKISSDAYSLVLLCLYASVFVKQLFLDLSFSAYATELFIALGSSFYVLVRNMRIGSPHFSRQGRRFYLFGAVLVGAIVLLISFGANRDSYTSPGLMAVSLGLSLVSGVGAFFAVQLILRGLERRRIKTIERHLDEDEDKLDD